MQKKDFKFLNDLPDGYEYQFETFDNRLTIIGIKDASIIGFWIEENGLRPLNFRLAEK